MHRPISEYALGDLNPQRALNDRRKGTAQTPSLWSVTPPHLEHVAKALGGDQTRASDFTLEQRIGAHSRPVNDGRYTLSTVGCIGIRPAIGLRDTIHKPCRLSATVGRYLQNQNGLRLFVQHEQVGEGASHIDTQNALSTFHRAHAFSPGAT